MSNANIGYLYYKEYYDEFIIKKFCEKHIEESKKDRDKETENYFNKKNQAIFGNSNISEIKKIRNIYSGKIQKCDKELFFKTTYPGLLVGSGYNHIISETGEFKLGFEFDYNTGLPIINGSSVKGLLRSVFYNEKDRECVKKEKQTYLKEIMQELGINTEEINIKELTNEIFEGKLNDNSIPMYERDIFYDAVIDIEKTEKEIGTNKNILGEDFITPHKDPLKNPIPLKFLKVMPNVVWRFNFNLKDRILKSYEKLDLFKQIIVDFGIGAKTNVGYGRFDEEYHI